jgi:type IV secretion system protein VirD4
MLKTLAARIIFPPNDMEDARNVSEELGYTTMKSRSRNVPGVMSGGKRSPSTNVSDQRRALMLPQEIKEMPADRQLLFVEHVLPVKCHKIRYFDDPIFRKRLLPAPGVKQQDVSTYTGGRTDDHFAMWQERLTREGRSVVPLKGGAVLPIGPSSVGTVQAAGEFSLDFSAVQIPPGRFLTGSELDAAVHSFLDELETA